jgi:hypothetical protein
MRVIVYLLVLAFGVSSCSSERSMSLFEQNCVSELHRIHDEGQLVDPVLQRVLSGHRRKTRIQILRKMLPFVYNTRLTSDKGEYELSVLKSQFLPSDRVRFSSVVAHDDHRQTIQEHELDLDLRGLRSIWVDPELTRIEEYFEVGELVLVATERSLASQAYVSSTGEAEIAGDAF